MTEYKAPLSVREHRWNEYFKLYLTLVEHDSKEPTFAIEVAKEMATKALKAWDELWGEEYANEEQRRLGLVEESQGPIEYVPPQKTRTKSARIKVPTPR